MRRTLVAAGLAGATLFVLSVPILVVSAAPTRTDFVAAGSNAPEVMPDRAAVVELHGIAAIAADQARTLRREVRRCAAGSERGRCATLALAHAGAGAKLNGVVLHALVARLPPGPCVSAAGRLGGFMSTISYLAVEGSRGAAWHPAETWGAARAVARVGGRVIAAADRSPRHCTGAAGGLSA
jgi:hypothetical protein